MSYDGVSLNAGGVRLPLAPGTSGGAVRRVLDQQRYRLSCWRDDTPNYRRFFEINDLIGMRVLKTPQCLRRRTRCSFDSWRKGRCKDCAWTTSTDCETRPHI